MLVLTQLIVLNAYLNRREKVCGKKESIINAFLAQLCQQSTLEIALLERFFIPIVLRFSDWIDDLPASEQHHHSNKYGLLKHSFEVTLIADRLFHDVVITSLTESLVQKQRDEQRIHLFLLVATLLHDVGKSFYDVKVMSDAELWNPLIEPLALFNERHSNSVCLWRSDRRHGVHEHFNALIALKVLPSNFLSLLQETPSFTLNFFEILNGDSSHVVMNVVRKADQLSVSNTQTSQDSQARRKTTTHSLRSEGTGADAMQAINELKEQMIKGEGRWLFGEVIKEGSSLIASLDSLKLISKEVPNATFPLLIGLLALPQTPPVLRVKKECLSLEIGDR